jgi:probable phosphoglycerate mutase
VTSFLVRRHALSLWNAERRIQGSLPAPGLTREGVRQAREWAESLPSRAGYTAVWSSDAARARQTAAPAARRLGLPVLSTGALREVGAGVLEGCRHADAQGEHVDAYRHWMARGDLDGVPGAETGDELQARCLSFVAVAAGPGNVGRQVVVTHAATMRSLVNTCLGRPRTTPLAVGHGDVHELRDPWERLAPRQLGASWRPPVFRVDTADRGYVLKARTAGMDEIYSRVDKAIGAPHALAVVADPRAPGTVVVARHFVPGRTVPHRISVADEFRLWDFLEHVARTTSDTVTGPETAGLPTLADRVAAALGHGTEATPQLRRLVADRRVTDLLARREAVADFDLHRDNVVADRSGLTKIDGDGLCAGPAAWPVAAALVGASALYPSATPASERPHALMDESSELRILVRVRLLLGLSFFCTGVRATSTAAEPYRELYRRAIEAAA